MARRPGAAPGIAGFGDLRTQLVCDVRVVLFGGARVLKGSSQMIPGHHIRLGDGGNIGWLCHGDITALLCVRIRAMVPGDWSPWVFF